MRRSTPPGTTAPLSSQHPGAPGTTARVAAAPGTATPGTAAPGTAAPGTAAPARLGRRAGLVAAATAVLTVGAVAVVGAAVATPGSGDTVSTGSVTGRLAGTGVGPGHRPFVVEQDGVALTARGATDVTTFDLTYPPGSYSGWHSHPGIVVAVVRSGEVVRQSGCTRERFRAGDAFTEVGAHHVSNPSATEPAVLSITRIYPASGAATPRIDEPAPTCPRPGGPKGS